MNHYAELAVTSFLQKAMAGKATMSKEVAKQVASDVEAALHKQFNSGPRDKFKLRMSNVGKPTCQLWFEKNDPEAQEPFPSNFLLNMLLGDIVEAVFKGLLRASGIDFKDNSKVTLELEDSVEINGEYDMELDGKIDDIKSASPWSFDNKFADFSTLNVDDSFGYVSQLVGYATAADKKVGGWWVVNKGNGKFKYVSAETVNTKKVLQEIQNTVDYINNDEPFKRCFEPVPETYYRKPTGNIVLNKKCKFCNFKHKCYPTLQTLPSKVSKSDNPPLVDYTFIGDGNG